MLRMRRALVMLLTVGCSSTEAARAPLEAGPDPRDHVFGGDRPVEVFRAPDAADPKEPLPLVMVLHGYGASGLLQSLYFGLDALVDEKKFLLVAPDGRENAGGSRFWAAVDGCCEAASGEKVDDVKYLTGLVDEIASVWSVDRRRVYLVGHSNGGAMAYRLGCDPKNPFAAAFLLAPAFFAEHTTCAPSVPFSIRHVHGTADETVAFEGGSIGLLGPTLKYTSATAAVEAWAKLNGCAATPDESAAPIDLDRAVAGAETKITRYPSCREGVATELLTMEGSTHVPFDLTPDLGRHVWEFLASHPRP